MMYIQVTVETSPSIPVRVLVHRGESGKLIAQVLERYFVVQGDDEDQLYRRLWSTFLLYRKLDLLDGREPFTAMDKAPTDVWETWEAAEPVEVEHPKNITFEVRQVA